MARRSTHKALKAPKPKKVHVVKPKKPKIHHPRHGHVRTAKGKAQPRAGSIRTSNH